MPVEVKRYICTVSGKEFASEELALISESVHSRTSLWIEEINVKVGEQIKKAEEAFTEFIKTFKKAQGLENTPTFITVIPSPKPGIEKAVILVISPFANNKALSSQGLMFWEVLVDLLIGIGTLQGNTIRVDPVALVQAINTIVNWGIENKNEQVS
jgi:hypothetical protein